MFNVKSVIGALVLFALTLATAEAAREKYMPFNLAYLSKSSPAVIEKEVKEKLQGGGFTVLASYSPYENAQVVIATHDKLKAVAAKTEFGGYGAVVRVGITKVGDETQVSYTNPGYMFHTYQMDEGSDGEVKAVEDLMAKTLGNEKEFGVSKALSTRKLRQYKYMFGMEEFTATNVHLIAEHASYEEAIKILDGNITKGNEGISKIYRLDIPGKKQTIFGVDMQEKNGGSKLMSDKFIMGQIDFNPLKATAHLPIEILVNGDGKVYSLYYRFRIAMNFPELSMMGENSFMNIVESPEAAKKALTKAAGGVVKSSDWPQ